jgi:hypothetical protein
VDVLVTVKQKCTFPHQKDAITAVQTNVGIKDTGKIARIPHEKLWMPISLIDRTYFDWSVLLALARDRVPRWVIASEGHKSKAEKKGRRKNVFHARVIGREKRIENL